MFVRLLLPLVGIVLFFCEPIFSLFSPVLIDGSNYFLVPHFVFMFLIFLAVYYDRKKSIYYAIIFGLIYDIVFIDIVGLYVVLYPLFCIFTSWVVKMIQQNLAIITILTMILVAILEMAVYEFFSILSITTISFNEFLIYRLTPTIIGNLIILILLGWLFKYLIKTRKLQSV